MSDLTIGFLRCDVPNMPNQKCLGFLVSRALLFVKMGVRFTPLNTFVAKEFLW